MKLDQLSTVLLSNQSVVRSGLRMFLQEAGWGQVVEASLESFAEALSDSALPIGLAVIDTSQAWERCLKIAEQLIQAIPGVPLLILCAHKETRYVRKVLDLGARGYVLEQASKEEFKVACRAVASGGLYVDPQVALALFRERTRPILETRKQYILSGLARGANNQALARELNISVSSVKMSIRELFAEYGVRNRLELLEAVESREQLTQPDRG